MSHAVERTDRHDEHEIKYLFIRRPVLAGVISIVITLLGLFSIRLLPVSRYPQITPPSVQVLAFYPGATAETVAQAVAAPIEEQLSGLQGLLYYQSANTSDGSMTLQIFFDVSRDQDLAAVDVQNAVKLAEPRLPDAVRQNGVTIIKANSDILAVLALTSTESRYDAPYLTNYLKLYVEDEIKRVPGVGNATTFGGLEFSMLLQLDPERMSKLGITVGDVASAVREQNATNPAGRIGREPAPSGTDLTVPVTTLGRLQTPEQFDEIVVRAKADGSLVRLRDIGKAVLGSRNYDFAARLNGTPTAFTLLYLRPGANALAVREAVQRRMDELAVNFPAGVRYQIPFDTTPFVTASIEEVVTTLLEAMALVAIVVFLFLQSGRATLIPMLAVPVSVIGTFLGLLLLGFSINVLTLFALVLAIGIVVDDAIVVIENVERIMASEGVSARVAADRAIRQVAGALIAIVLALCAVFVPVGFTGGVTGELFRQFAITIVIAVVLSGIVALTLTPALCALLLKESNEAHTMGFFGAFNRGFARVTRGYVGAVDRVLGRPRAWLAAFIVLVGLAAVLWQRVPTAFIPTEDKGYLALAVQLPDGASLQRTQKVVEQVEGFLRDEPAVLNIVALAGLDILSRSNQTNGATVFVNVKPWDERSPENSIDAIAARLNRKLFGMKEAIGFAFNLPEIPGLGATSGIEANIQNRSGQDLRTFSNQVQNLVQAVNQLPPVQAANTNFRANVPQIFIDVDRATAKARGVSLGDLFGTLQAFLSTLYINDFNLYGRTYRVQAEAVAQYRQSPEDIGRLYVRGRDDAMIPVSALTTTQFRAGPTLLLRFNGFTSALLTGTPRPGRSSGEVLDAVDELVRTQFAPQGVGVAYSGQSYQERLSSGASGLVFVLGLIIVFLVLAAQYESWSVPFAVLLGVPFGVLGALLGIWLRGQPSDVYFQIGLITVVGLAAKNAILIVEFATELRHRGLSVRAAAVEAARERFRPILMTSFAFILGVSPLVVAGGAGAESRHSIGTCVFAGMLFATTIGIFFIPLFFRIIRGGFGSRANGLNVNAATVTIVLLLALVVSGCAVGPRYEPPPPVEAEIGGAHTSDSARVMFDSLATAPEITASISNTTRRAETAQSLEDVAWLDILQDSVLHGLVVQALRDNREIASARARIDEYHALVGIAKAPLFPSLTANATAGRSQIAVGAFPPTAFTAIRITGDVAWELDFWGRVRRGLQAADADFDAQTEAERARILTLVSDVATGYLQLLELDQERSVSERTLASRRATLDLARQRFAQGLISELDVRQFEAQLAAPAVRLAQVEEQRAIQEHALSQLIGLPPTTIERGTSLQAAAVAITVPDSVSATLLERRPDVAQAERAYAAANARIGVADAARLPSIAIGGSYGTQATNVSDLFTSATRVYQAQVGVAFPLFRGGALANQARATRARAEQARAQYEQTVLVALRESSDALAGVRATRDQVLAQTMQTNALRRALELAQVRYNSGVSNYLEVLDAQRSLFAAELALSQTQLRQLTAAVQLYKALGGSWPTDPPR
jgi:multidrug efflux pump